MRKLVSFLAAFALIVFGAGTSPAQADPVVGSVACQDDAANGISGSGTFEVALVDGAYVATAGSTCVGLAAIPEGVTAIGAEAFRNAIGLTSITMPSGLTSIGSNAFYDASSLTSAPIPSTVTSIGSAAFYGATELTSIVIPRGVTSIESLTFYGAAKLSSVSFAAGSLLTEIKNQAFEKNYVLESITIPAGVTEIGNRAFSEALSLRPVTFLSDRTLLTIGYATFYQAPITDLVVPSSVNAIGAYAFEGTSLSSIYFLGNAAPEMDLTESPFYDIAFTPKAYIKAGATGFDPIEFARSPEETDPELRGHGVEVEVFIYSVSHNNQSATWAQRGGSDYYLKGSAISAIPTTPPVKSGHTFTGWYTAKTGGTKVTNNSYTPASPYGEVVLYARWTKNPVKAVATVKPAVYGTANVSKKLTAKRGFWSGYPTPTYSYRWYCCTTQVKNATSSIPKNCKLISKATKSTLVVTSSLKGKYISVAVTGKGTGTSATRWLSKSTAKVK